MAVQMLNKTSEERSNVSVRLPHSTREELMKNLLMKLWKEEEGQDLTEYALLLVLLSLAAVGSLNVLATAINKVFNNAATNLNAT